MKKLPKVFANKVDKKAGNNEKVFYSDHDIKDEKEEKTIIKNKNINQKINDIFNSSNYIYKADVIIKLKNKTVTKRIIGRNNQYIMTIDNKLIPISDIIDINKKQN